MGNNLRLFVWRELNLRCSRWRVLSGLFAIQLVMLMCVWKFLRKLSPDSPDLADFTLRGTSAAFENLTSGRQEELLVQLVDHFTCKNGCQTRRTDLAHRMWHAISNSRADRHILEMWQFTRQELLHRCTEPTGTTMIDCAALQDSTRRAERDLRIFVYELPAEFNVALYRNKGIFGWALCHEGYAADIRLHEALLQSRFRTLVPEDATMFFVPVYLGSGYWHFGEEKVKELIRSAYAFIQQRYSRFMPTGKGRRNQIIACPFDHGCAWPKDVPDDRFVKVGTHVSNHIILPPCCIRPDKWRPLSALRWQDFVPPLRKKIDVFFQGGSQSGFRKLFVTAYQEWRKAAGHQSQLHPPLPAGIKLQPIADHKNMFVDSTTCFLPRGYAEWTGRDGEAIFAGCIPVTFGNKIWPLSRFIDWKQASINIPDESERGLAKTLDIVAETLADPGFVEKTQRNIQYLWPFFTFLPSSIRGQSELFDQMGLFIAELTHFLPDV